jgi:hypothetical protein
VTAVFERLTDIGHGIDRLQRAVAVIGESRYSAICRELNFASDTIDDIPNRNGLKALLSRVEAETVQASGGAPKAPAMTIADARGRLLQAARKTAERTRKRLADVIAEASDGKLSLDGLKNLTDADVSLVAAAMSRMA